MAIHLPYKKLSHWQSVALSAALLERMLPNYQLFSESVEFGDYKILRNQLDLIWQWLSPNKPKINIDAQLEKLEEQTPDVDNFDFFGVYPALDSCMALTALWQGIQGKEVKDLADVSYLSENSVGAYVELLLAEEVEDITPADIKQHPLMAWEIATQNELFDFIKDAPENVATAKQAKTLALAEGMSNIGIEL